MLRIHVQEGLGQTRLRLEGRLGGEWVVELKSCCYGLMDAFPRTRLIIDLDAVSFVDPEGEKALAELRICGAQLTGKGPLTEFMVSRIEREFDKQGGSTIH